jgi:hypothetical protein
MGLTCEVAYKNVEAAAVARPKINVPPVPAVKLIPSQGNMAPPSYPPPNYAETAPPQSG